MLTVVSFSGGKDSTATALLLQERGINPRLLYFDTGWEFPQMHDHIKHFLDVTGLDIVRMKPRKPFEYYFNEHKFTRRADGEELVGYGWPKPYKRWCTNIKTEALDLYLASMSFIEELPITCAVGFSYDELHRRDKLLKNKEKVWYVNYVFPLIEEKMTEKDALEYCKKMGFTWGGAL